LSAISNYLLNPLTDPRWTDFIQRHPQASVFHSAAWMESLQHTYGYKPFVITTSGPDEALANGLALCRVESRITGNRLVSLPFADHCDPLVPSAQLPEFIDHIRSAQDGKNCKYVELRPRAANSESPSGFGTSAQYWLHTLDLAPELKDIFGRFHDSCTRRRIRHAERMNLSYEESRTPAAVTDFYRLQTLTRTRHSLPPQPAKWFENLRKSFAGQLTVHTVSVDGRPIASMITLRHGSTLTCKYAASDARFHQLGSMVMLFWKVIQGAKASGMLELDLGRSDMDTPGLVAFKDHWGATRSVISYLRSPEPTSVSGSHRGLALAKKLFAFAPQRLAELAGSVLYKHAG
jgi:lipid II:glycine glycyltransferase (peptidoglycan interpeptide bridge formation enzyme)